VKHNTCTSPLSYFGVAASVEGFAIKILLASVYLLAYLSLPDCYTLVAGLLARSQYPEGPTTGHLGTGFHGFPVSISEC
jgi:hypothetical protein